MFLKNYFFQNFRGCVLLFSYQGSCQFLTAQIFYHIVLRLSRTFLIFLDCHSFATALLFYHVLFCLSSTFFIFLCDVFLHRSELPYNSTPSSIRQPLFLHFFLFLLYRPLTNISGCRQDSGCSAPVPVFL